MFGDTVRSLSDEKSDFCYQMFASRAIRRMAAEALTETDRWQKRNRCLPALIVLWLVVMMALHRAASIPNVFLRIRMAAQARWGGNHRLDVTDEALYHARLRLGVEPLEAMFRRTAEAVQPETSFAGFRVWVIDGTGADVADTPANEEKWGRPGASRGTSAFPQLKLVLLVCAVSRQVRAIQVLPCTAAEVGALPALLEFLGPTDLLFLDRGFASYQALHQCASRGIHVVMRIQSSYRPERVRRYGVGDDLIRASFPQHIPEHERTGKRRTRDVAITARLITYWFRLHEKPVRLLTTLPQEVPARWIAVGYHIRWEVELAIDELKTHLSSVLHGTVHTTFRGKSPTLVLQEVYGLMIAYNLVRATMLDAAVQYDLNPLYISFVDSLEVMRAAAPYFLSKRTEDWPKLRAELLQDVAGCALRRPRRKKRYPRGVKRKMSNFKLKKREEVGEDCDFLKEIKLQEADPAGLAA